MYLFGPSLLFLLQLYSFVRTSDESTVEFSNSTEKKTIIISTVELSPFFMVKKHCSHPSATGCDGFNKYEGYSVDLLELFRSLTGWKFEVNVDFIHRYLQVKIATKFGSKQTNGTWDGMIGQIITGEADMTTGPLVINSERLRAVDFSMPFMSSSLSVMIKKPTMRLRTSDGSIFLKPLSCTIWIFIVISYIGVALIAFLLSRLSAFVDNSSIPMTFCNSLWFPVASLLQQETGFLPHSTSGRIVSAIWWFFALVIIASYTANFAAILTLNRMTTPNREEINLFLTLEELVNQDRVKVGMQKGGTTARFFKNSNIALYQRMWRKMEANPDVFVKSYKEGIDNVRNQPYAFILETIANDFENGRWPCDTMKIGQNINAYSYGLAFSKGNPLKDSVSAALLTLQERGDLLKIYSKWWIDRNECEISANNRPEPNVSLDFTEISGLFWILLGGLLLSLSVGLVEFICRRIKEKKNPGKLSEKEDLVE